MSSIRLLLQPDCQLTMPAGIMGGVLELSGLSHT